MTPAEAFDAQPAAAPRSVPFDGLGAITRAARHVAARSARPRDKMKRRAKNHSVNEEQRQQQSFHLGSRVPQNREPLRQAQPFLAQFREGRNGRSRLRRDHKPDAVGKQAATGAKDLAHTSAQAISLHSSADSAGRDNSHAGWRRGVFGRPLQHAHTQPAALDHSPLGAHCEKFTGLAQPRGGGKAFQGKRLDHECGEPEELRLGVTGEVDFDALREKALATASAAAVEDGAAILGGHPSAEAELLLARALGRLIRAFHKLEKSPRT